MLLIWGQKVFLNVFIFVCERLQCIYHQRPAFGAVFFIFRQIPSRQLLKKWFFIPEHFTDGKWVILMLCYYITFIKQINWFYVHNRPIYRRVLYYFLRQVIWITYSSNFVSFGPTEYIVELSEDGILLLDGPV